MNPTVDPALLDLTCPTQSATRLRAFWGVMLAFLVHGLVVSTWVSRIASVKQALALSDGALGMALLGAALGSVASIPITGALLHRYGARVMTILSAAAFSLALLPLAWSNNFASLSVALVIYGVVSGANDVSMNALAVGTERMLATPTISRFHGMFSFGGIFGAAAGGFIAGRGVSTETHIAAAVAIILMVTAAFSRMIIDTRTETKPTAKMRWHHLPLPLAALGAIGFCIFLTEGAIADWTAVYLKQVLRSSDSIAPIGYAVFSAAMAIFRFTGDAITLKLGRATTIRTGGLLAATGLALVGIAQTPALALAGFALSGAGFSSIIPLVFAAGGRIPGVGEGTGVATVSGLGYLGFLVGPPAIGFISELSSLRFGIFFLVVLSASAALLVTVVERSSLKSGVNPLAD